MTPKVGEFAVWDDSYWTGDARFKVSEITKVTAKKVFVTSTYSPNGRDEQFSAERLVASLPEDRAQKLHAALKSEVDEFANAKEQARAEHAARIAAIKAEFVQPAA